MPHRSRRSHAAWSTNRAGTRPDPGSAVCRAGPSARPRRATQDLWQRLDDLEQDHRLPGSEPVATGLAQAMHSWARGMPWSGCSIEADMAAGDFVRWAKQTIDLLDQLSLVADPPSPRPRAKRSTRFGAASSPTARLTAGPLPRSLSSVRAPRRCRRDRFFPCGRRSSRPWRAGSSSPSPSLLSAGGRWPSRPSSSRWSRLDRQERRGLRCWSGFAFGASFFFVNLVFTARYLGPVPWIALSMLEAVLTAAGADPDHAGLSMDAAGAAGARWARLILLPVLVAGLWTLREQIVGSWPYGGLSRGARIGITQASSPLAHLVSWVGVSGLTFLMVAVLRCGDRVRPSRAVPRAATAVPTVARRAAACARARSSRPRRPARCASARCRVTVRRDTSTSGPPTRCWRPSWRRRPRCSASRWTFCSGRREASTPIPRPNASTARVLDALARADRRTAYRQRRRPRAATSTSIRRCCGSRARAPCRPTTSGIPCRSGSTSPTGRSSSRSRPI